MVIKCDRKFTGIGKKTTERKLFAQSIPHSGIGAWFFEVDVAVYRHETLGADWLMLKKLYMCKNISKTNITPKRQLKRKRIVTCMWEERRRKSNYTQFLKYIHVSYIH